MDANISSPFTRYIMRYGVFTLLLVMLVGLSWLAHTYQLRVKQPIDLFLTPTGCQVYTPLLSEGQFTSHDTLEIYQTTFGDFAFTIDTLYTEPTATVLLLSPIDNVHFQAAVAGNTHLEGFIYIGQEPIITLLLRKLHF